jgi:hypothetical protein
VRQREGPRISVHIHPVLLGAEGVSTPASKEDRMEQPG